MIFKKNNVKLVNSYKLNLSKDKQILVLKAQIEECEKNIDDLSRKILNQTLFNNDTIYFKDKNLLDKLHQELNFLKEKLEILEN